MQKLIINSIGLTTTEETDEITIKPIKYTKDTEGWFTVLLNVNGFNIWLDVDQYYRVGWNCYIFLLSNSIDKAIWEIQESAENLELCSSIAIEFLESEGVL